MELSRRGVGVAALALLCSSPALAADDSDFVWAGAGWDAGLVAGPTDVAALPTQVELDVQAAKGPLWFRLDLDVHVDPNLPREGSFYVAPVPPEEAFVQIGRRHLFLKAGVSNPSMGLQEWDAWANYLPAYSTTWAVQPGQVLGGNGGWRTSGGTVLGVYGGQDLGWGAPIVGAYVASEQDAFSTWSGVAAWPTMGYYAAFPSVELYPADWLWVDVDGAVGLVKGAGFGGGQLVLNFFPESEPNPVIRLEKLVDPKGALRNDEDIGLDLPDTAFAVGMNVNPADWLRLSAEGRVEWYRGAVESSGIFYIGVHPTEEPDGFLALDGAE